MIINHNLPALNAHRQMGINNDNISKSLEKLSSGLGINRASDNAAGLAISEKMRGQISGLEQASSNAQDGISLIQTAEGALNETHSILQRMRELAVQSSNGTYQDDVDRDNIQTEIDALKEEVDRIATSTNFNGLKLLDGTSSSGKVTYGKVESTTVAQSKDYNDPGAVTLGDTTVTINIDTDGQDRFRAAFGDANGDIPSIIVECGAQSAAAGTITLKKADGTEVVSLTGLDTTAAIATADLTADQVKALTDAGIDATTFATAAAVGTAAASTTATVTEQDTFAAINSSGTAGTLFEDAADDGTGVQLMFDENSTLTKGNYTISYNADSQYITITSQSGEEIDKAKVGAVINAGDQIKFEKTGTTLRFGSAVADTTLNSLSGSTTLAFYQASTGRHAITGATGAVVPSTDTTILSGTEFGAAAVGGAADLLAIDFGSTEALNGYSIKFMGNTEDGVAAEVDKDAKTITIKLDSTTMANNTAKAVQDALKAQATSLGVNADDIKVTASVPAAGTNNWGTTTGVAASTATQTLTIGLGIEAGAKSVTTNDLSTTVNFTQSTFKAGSTVTVGSKTYELVENGKAATNENATAISISDFEDKTAIVKAIADAASLQPDVLVTADKNVMTVQNKATNAKEAIEVSLEEMGGITFQIGANGVKDQRVTLSVQDQSSSGLGIADIDCSTREGANSAIAVIDDAINKVSGTRADLGALQNRMEHTISSLGVSSENLTAAESRIRDVDMAKEMMAFTKNQILAQASQAMLAQANTLPQGVLQLLQ